MPLYYAIRAWFYHRFARPQESASPFENVYRLPNARAATWIERLQRVDHSAPDGSLSLFELSIGEWNEAEDIALLVDVLADPQGIGNRTRRGDLFIERSARSVLRAAIYHVCRTMSNPTLAGALELLRSDPQQPKDVDSIFARFYVIRPSGPYVHCQDLRDGTHGYFTDEAIASELAPLLAAPRAVKDAVLASARYHLRRVLPAA